MVCCVAEGAKDLEIVTDSDRDNTTILAAISASGTTLPPLIIFQGKQVQIIWRPSSDPTREHFPWIYANESGWMKADVFHKWFVEWEARTRTANNEGELETRLMMYDVHLSHVNYATIKLARETKVTILKSPPHATYLVQPLDVAVFKSLKQKMGSSVIQMVTENLKCAVKVRICNNNF